MSVVICKAKSADADRLAELMPQLGYVIEPAKLADKIADFSRSQSDAVLLQNSMTTWSVLFPATSRRCFIRLVTAVALPAYWSNRALETKALDDYWLLRRKLFSLARSV